MRKFLSLLLGLSLGWSIGALIVIFFAPLTAEELKAHWQDHYDRALAAGREASARRRAELEQELKELGKD
jgi:gas vesicle protein